MSLSVINEGDSDQFSSPHNHNQATKYHEGYHESSTDDSDDPDLYEIRKNTVKTNRSLTEVLDEYFLQNPRASNDEIISYLDRIEKEENVNFNHDNFEDDNLIKESERYAVYVVDCFNARVFAITRSFEKRSF